MSVLDMPIGKARKRAKEIEEAVLFRNGSVKDRDFTNKEVYLLLLDEMNKKLSKHIEFCENMTNKYIPEFNKQVEILNQVCKDLPEKGFCEKINIALFPEKDIPMAEKVNLLWNDRRWLKGILYFLIAIGLGNLLLFAGKWFLTGSI